MSAYARNIFLALVAVQALHSVEEHVFELWAVFPPARFLTGLISQDLEFGFLVINIGLFAFGLACYWWPVRRGWSSAVGLAWLWVGIEAINGIGHPAWAVLQRGYTPGLVTSLALGPLAVLLARQLMHGNGSLTPSTATRAETAIIDHTHSPEGSSG